MTEWHLKLLLLPELYGIARLAAYEPVPAWAVAGAFSSITRTADELSLVCLEQGIPEDVQVERGWRCLKVEGPFDLEGAIGVLVSLLTPLARGGIGIFAISTYDTDYLLIKDRYLQQATALLHAAGHQVTGGA